MEAVTNTSPLLYLHRTGLLHQLPKIFEEIWTPQAVLQELEAGRQRGYEVPLRKNYPWLKQINPAVIPPEWLFLELGAGELATMALTREFPDKIVLLDDNDARAVAKAEGVQVWGTLKVILDFKTHGIVKELAPIIQQLRGSGMWISDKIELRILRLAGE